MCAHVYLLANNASTYILSEGAGKNMTLRQVLSFEAKVKPGSGYSFAQKAHSA